MVGPLDTSSVNSRNAFGASPWNLPLRNPSPTSHLRLLCLSAIGNLPAGLTCTGVSPMDMDFNVLGPVEKVVLILDLVTLELTVS